MKPKREKYVGQVWTLKVEPFGYPIYPCDLDLSVTWTDKFEEATRFDSRDARPTKIKFFTALAAVYFGQSVDAEVVTC